MSEAVLDNAIEQIADGLTVDWNAIDKAAPARERDWARSLRVLNDIVNLHREAAVDYEHTTLVSAGPAHPSSASTLDTWGRYRLANKVGEGSYGSVYRAWDSDLERDVAIKILHRRVGDNAAQRSAAARRTRAGEDRPQQRRQRARRRGARRSRWSVHGVRAREDPGRHRPRPGEDERGRSGAHRRGSVPRAVGRASRRLHPSRRQGQERHARRQRPDRADGLRHRSDDERRRARAIARARRSTWRRKSSRAGRRRRAATCTAWACCSITSSPAIIRSGPTPSTNCATRTRTAGIGGSARLRPDLPVAFMQVVERAIALDPEERYANASELLAALSALQDRVRTRSSCGSSRPS